MVIYYKKSHLLGVLLNRECKGPVPTYQYLLEESVLCLGAELFSSCPQMGLFLFHVAVTVSVPSIASFPEDATTPQVCATLTGMTAVNIDVTVSATDGKLLPAKLSGRWSAG